MCSNTNAPTGCATPKAASLHPWLHSAAPVGPKGEHWLPRVARRRKRRRSTRGYSVAPLGRVGAQPSRPGRAVLRTGEAGLCPDGPCQSLSRPKDGMQCLSRCIPSLGRDKHCIPSLGRDKDWHGFAGCGARHAQGGTAALRLAAKKEGMPFFGCHAPAIPVQCLVRPRSFFS